MKKLFSALLLLIAAKGYSQTAENIIIITTDGFRWQEVFTGMDSSIANNKKFNQGDSAYIFKHYWNDDATERRKMLMPFFWSTFQAKGQIYGNRNYDSKVNNANRYWFSYPGYNEIFTGYPDTIINSNSYPDNPNTNVLEFLNKQPKFKGRVAAFGAWDAFDRILNEKRSGFPVFSGFDKFGGTNPNNNEKLINTLSGDAYSPFGNEECLDVFTHYAAMEYLKNKHPKVLYISYGETDEWAHSEHYKDYLNAVHQVDKWISDLWNYIQSDPFYKNKTAIFFTVDHGRGLKDDWTSHWSTVPNSNEIWFATMGPGIRAKGEMKRSQQFYQEQFAQTFASLLGLEFKAEHPIGKKIMLNQD